MNLVLLTVSLLISTSEVEAVVKKFHELDSKKSESAFIENYGLSTEPSVLAYVCAIEMKQAEYKFNPFSKLEIFNRSKKKLNELIASNPTDVHLRYIRLFLQEQTPAVLGYKNYIEEDKIFLSKALKAPDASDYLDAYIYKFTSL